MKRFSILSASLVALALNVPTWADIHHFGYVTETGVLPQGASEIEVWNTARLGDTHYYYGLDQSLEFETGLTDRLQASLYLNWNKTTADTGGDRQLADNFDWQGLSAELKYKISDASADPIGFALYSEFEFDTDEMELETKALFDKDVDSWTLAANLIGEFEFDSRNPKLTEIELQPTAGAAYQVTPNFTAGLELRSYSAIERGLGSGSDGFGLASSALYVGPALSYTTKAMTVTFSVLPNLHSFKNESGFPQLDDDDAVKESMEMRLHLSMHF